MALPASDSVLNDVLVSVSELRSVPELTSPAPPSTATSLWLWVNVSDSESVAEKLVE